MVIDYGIDADMMKKIEIRGCSGLLSPFMIILSDGDVSAVANEAELEDELKIIILDGRSDDIVYIFCDMAQMDLGFEIQLELSQSRGDFGYADDPDADYLKYEAEQMDKQMQEAMAADEART